MPATSMKRTTVDLLSLLEDTVEGGWIGARARSVYGTADIGTAYSPPTHQASQRDTAEGQGRKEGTVETILDIGYRSSGWLVRCEKGGIRRVLMNLLGNSLKFTQSGFVHIRLREVQQTAGSTSQRFQLTVLDSGKGISKNFLQNQMFQPFSQENPSHTGTGLGLAIVNSIVRSEGLNGKVEVYSTEGAGTEISITFEVDPPSQKAATRSNFSHTADKHLRGAKVHMVGFDEHHRGQALLDQVISSYMTEWWGVDPVKDRSEADVLFINDNLDILMDLIHREDVNQPVLFLTAARGNSQVASIIKSFEQLGGSCFILYKPCRPSNLFAGLEHALQASIPARTNGGDSPSAPRQWRAASVRSISPHDALFTRPPLSRKTAGTHPSHMPSPSVDSINPAFTRRRHSDEAIVSINVPGRRPHLQRSHTDNPRSALIRSPRLQSPYDTSETMRRGPSSDAKGKGAHRPRVLVVEDNNVNRALLAQWLKKKGFEFEEAMDGQQAVDLVRERPQGHFEVILMDISMPNLDGISATKLIRSIESGQGRDSVNLIMGSKNEFPSWPGFPRAKIFAVSGLATNDDKIQAFGAGMDGYLVKPVSFKVLSNLFSRLEAAARSSGNTSA